jgi:Flp pilus assembly protein TadD
MQRNAKAMTTLLRRSALGCVGLMALASGGCAGPGSDLTAGLLGTEPPKPATQDVAATPQTELQKATAYWGEKFAKSPNTLEYALNYSRNLKAMGRKREALAALQHASNYHAQNRELAGEYGRIALELDQVQTAKSVLNFADDPTKPDWRIVSARGTVAAKEGNSKEAIELFERAMALSNRNPSVMNNLAMAYALDGRPAEGERLLREAASKGNSEKVQKNLALVLGLQGKYDEAKVVGGRVLPHSTVAEDTKLVRQIVGLDPRPYAPMSTPATSPAVASSHLNPVVQQTSARAPALRATAQPAPAADTWSTQVATGSTR